MVMTGKGEDLGKISETVADPDINVDTETTDDMYQNFQENENQLKLIPGQNRIEVDIVQEDVVNYRRSNGRIYIEINVPEESLADVPKILNGFIKAQK